MNAGDAPDMRADIIAAIEVFEAWGQPWTFLGNVMAWPTLAVADRAMIQQIWMEACDAHHWQHGNGAQDAAAFSQALQEHFPWLTERARSQLVRAASYEWK